MSRRRKEPNWGSPGASALLSIAEWARRCGRSHERANRVVKAGAVPSAVRYITGHRDTYAIPEGTPWPFPSGAGGLARTQPLSPETP